MNLIELQQEAARQGFRLQPITKLDKEKARFAHCESQEDVDRVLATFPRGYVIDAAAIPTKEQLVRTRQIKTELRLRGIDPEKPAEQKAEIYP